MALDLNIITTVFVLNLPHLSHSLPDKLNSSVIDYCVYFLIVCTVSVTVTVYVHYSQGFPGRRS